MDIILRREQPADYREVEQLTYEAFCGMQLPGRTRTDEHFLAHILRTDSAFVPQLDYVAEADGKIVGNIMYSKSKVVGSGGKSCATLTFGPLSVLPALQGRGIGGRLVTKTIEEAAQMGYPAILIFGHPQYYARFGFENAARFGISTAQGENFDAFMALELKPGALRGISGRFYEAPVFTIDEEAFARYETAFSAGRA